MKPLFVTDTGLVTKKEKRVFKIVALLMYFIFAWFVIETFLEQNVPFAAAFFVWLCVFPLYLFFRGRIKKLPSHARLLIQVGWILFTIIAVGFMVPFLLASLVY